MNMREVVRDNVACLMRGNLRTFISVTTLESLELNDSSRPMTRIVKNVMNETFDYIIGKIMQEKEQPITAELFERDILPFMRERVVSRFLNLVARFLKRSFFRTVDDAFDKLVIELWARYPKGLCFPVTHKDNYSPLNPSRLSPCFRMEANITIRNMVVPGIFYLVNQPSVSIAGRGLNFFESFLEDIFLMRVYYGKRYVKKHNKFMNRFGDPAILLADFSNPMYRYVSEIGVGDNVFCFGGNTYHLKLSSRISDVEELMTAMAYLASPSVVERVRKICVFDNFKVVQESVCNDLFDPMKLFE